MPRSSIRPIRYTATNRDHPSAAHRITAGRGEPWDASRTRDDPGRLPVHRLRNRTIVIRRKMHVDELDVDQSLVDRRVGPASSRRQGYLPRRSRGRRRDLGARSRLGPVHRTHPAAVLQGHQPPPRHDRTAFDSRSPRRLPLAGLRRRSCPYERRLINHAPE